MILYKDEATELFNQQQQEEREKEYRAQENDKIKFNEIVEEEISKALLLSLKTTNDSQIFLDLGVKAYPIYFYLDDEKNINKKHYENVFTSNLKFSSTEIEQKIEELSVRNLQPLFYYMSYQHLGQIGIFTARGRIRNDDNIYEWLKYENEKCNRLTMFVSYDNFIRSINLNGFPNW